MEHKIATIAGKKKKKRPKKMVLKDIRAQARETGTTYKPITKENLASVLNRDGKTLPVKFAPKGTLVEGQTRLAANRQVRHNYLGGDDGKCKLCLYDKDHWLHSVRFQTKEGMRRNRMEVPEEIRKLGIGFSVQTLLIMRCRGIEKMLRSKSFELEELEFYRRRGKQKDGDVFGFILRYTTEAGKTQETKYEWKETT